MFTSSRPTILAPWKLLDIIIVIVAYVGSVFGLSLVAFALGLMGDNHSQLNASLTITIITDVLIVGLIIWLVRRRGGHPEQLGFRPLQSSAWHLPAVGFLLALGILLAYSALVEALGLEDFVPRNNAPKGVFDTTTSTVLFGSLAMIFAPFAEEVIFRGFLLGGLLKWFPSWAAVLISGALFGAVHGQIGVIIPIALIAILLAIIYLRANSIFASMGAHFLFNAVSFLATFLMERSV